MSDSDKDADEIRQKAFELLTSIGPKDKEDEKTWPEDPSPNKPMAEGSESSRGDRSRDIFGEELANLDSVFQDLTRDADALIDSIRNDDSKMESRDKNIKRQASSSGSVSDNDAHGYDSDSDISDIGQNHDDDITKESIRLTRVSEALRQDLEDVHCVNSAIHQLESNDEDEEDEDLNDIHYPVNNTSDESMRLKGAYPGAGGQSLNIVLLVVNIILLAFVGRLMYHAMNGMLDDVGRMESPFSF